MSNVDGGGLKQSQKASYLVKRPHHLVGRAVGLLMSVVLGFGAAKYAPHNWRRGMRWSDVYRGLQEHLQAWWDGEDYDPESHLPHLGHAACCLMFLCEYWFNTEYMSFDDRHSAPPVRQDMLGHRLFQYPTPEMILDDEDEEE